MNLSPDPRVARLQMLLLLFTLKLERAKRELRRPRERQPAGTWSW